MSPRQPPRRHSSICRVARDCLRWCPTRPLRPCPPQTTTVPLSDESGAEICQTQQQSAVRKFKNPVSHSICSAFVVFVVAVVLCREVPYFVRFAAVCHADYALFCGGNANPGPATAKERQRYLAPHTVTYRKQNECSATIAILIQSVRVFIEIAVR